ncbi:hypothetical protein P3X46_003593 [Hevea brasiliensis]|uniref:Uncharacterized protein n=1 Tax=Hevea brasiliensis TaxID=3981 RepID=A0ABQ9N6Q7_HEVBR|nr:uncharacterized protein LOC110661664 [Hevea brasiliensis]KAJ9188212.1 hypothetical protein P3X46_003593 [Hevea brasiliensis]
MGNCLFKGFGVEIQEMIKVVTTNGGVMELHAPITAECITNEFPGHAIYRSHDLSSPPLPHHEELQGGHLYYLLPISTNKNTSTTTNTTDSNNNAINSTSLSKLAPYRMSFDNQRVLKRLTDAVVFPRYNSTGVWKVKLVICPEQLAEILAQEARTEELIESVRTVAKCGNGVSSSVASSDQWSVSSSWKGSGEKCGEDDC